MQGIGGFGDTVVKVQGLAAVRAKLFEGDRIEGDDVGARAY